MGKIQEELKAAEKYRFQMDEKDGRLLALCRENIALAEFLIRNDSRYVNNADKAHKGTSAYWFSHLKDFYDGKGGDFAAIVGECINAVDRENSTHLNGDGKGRLVVKGWISELGAEKLRAMLEGRNFDLPALLTERTGDEKGSRRNPSFASKFCHYACFYLFEGSDSQDNFSIYDKILRVSVPFYAARYGVEGEITKNTDYKTYSDVIDSIIGASGAGISRNGFDHLLWYYHKAHPIQENSN